MPFDQSNFGIRQFWQPLRCCYRNKKGGHHLSGQNRDAQTRLYRSLRHRKAGGGVRDAPGPAARIKRIRCALAIHTWLRQNDQLNHFIPVDRLLVGGYPHQWLAPDAYALRLSTRLGFFLFAVGWALAKMAHGFATTWQGLAIFRGMLGATEAAAIPAGAKSVSEWFPARERPLATSAFQMGTSVGAIAAPPIVVFCILTWGWESAFIVTGALSLVWAVLWWVGYETPDRHRRLSKEERVLIKAGQEEASDAPRPSTRSEVIRSRGFWAIAIPRFFAEPAWQTFNFFIPLYLVAVWNLDLKSIALWAWMPFVAADLGSLAAGLLPP